MKSATSVGLGLIFLLYATFGFAQTYTIKDLGVYSGCSSDAAGINASGQVAANSSIWIDDGFLDGYYAAALRTAPNQPIQGYPDYLGTLFDVQQYPNSYTTGINASGQVVGYVQGSTFSLYSYRTGPQGPIEDELGNLGGGGYTWATGINDAGQAVGFSAAADFYMHAFRTAPNQGINPQTDDIGVVGENSYAQGINASGQVVGFTDSYAFRTAPNQPINPATDNLGPGIAYGINASGQVVGQSGGYAFRTKPNKPINPATDYLGSPGGSYALAINASGQVVGVDSGAGSFVYRNGVLYGLNGLIPANSGWVLGVATAINDAGQIVGSGFHRTRTSCGEHAYLLTPVKAPTSATLASTLNPSTYGQKITFTATVTNSFGTAPSGRVSLVWAGKGTIGTGALDRNGVARISTAKLKADHYLLAARYEGDLNNHSSQSPAFRQVIGPAQSTAFLSSSSNPSTAGQAITFTAQITSPTVIPAEPVTFTAGQTVLGTVQLAAGTAQLTTVLASGSTQITVTYLGDSNITKSSASLIQVVQP